MQKNQLKRNTKRIRSVLIGRGGKRGKTSGRGTKGQHARAGAKLRPEMRDFIKRLPKLRGRGVNSNKSVYTKPTVVTLSMINTNFTDGATVNPKTLLAKGLISRVGGKLPKVKILGTIESLSKFKVTGCDFSVKAKAQIEKSGGKILRK